MNKKFTISIPSSAYEPPRKEHKKTEISDQENSHVVRNDHYIEESQSDEERSDRPHKSNEKGGQSYPLVEFEEFTVERKPTHQGKDRKKRYEIEVPQIKFDQQLPSSTMAKRQPDNDDVFKEYICKQPPAPSKGSSKAKVFVFPTTQPTLPTAAQKDKPNRYGQTTIATPNNQHAERHQDRTEDDFAKERQRFERQLLVKDAQIDVLQKLIAQHLNMKYQFSSVHQAERILAEKDLRHAELLSKLQQMSSIVKDKNEQISQLKYQNDRLQNALQSLQHNIYLLTKKDENMKLTRDYMEMRQQHQQQQEQQHHTKSYWEEDRRSSLKQNGCIRNIEDLEKRLDFLKNNRIQLEASKSRQKNKSVLTSMPKEEVLWCSMTTKHRPKGAFDFKFQKERSIEGSFLEKGKKKQPY